MRLTNTAEGGSNGTTVTAANSGGASFDAWSTNPTIGSGAALVFDSAQAMHGTLSYRFSTGGSAVQCKLPWTFTGAATIQWRLYVRTPSAFTNLPTIFRLQGAGTQAIRLAWNASGNLVVRDTANAQQAQSSTTFTTGAWYRIEGYCTAGSSSVAEVKIWSTPDDTGTATETISLSAKNFGTANIDTCEIGQVASTANIPQWWADDITISDTQTYMGPVTTAQAVAALAAAGTLAGPGVDVGQAAAALTAAGTLAGAGVFVGQTAAALTAAGTLAAAGTRVHPAGAALTAAGTVTADATVEAGAAQQATATLAAAGSLTAGGTGVRPATAALASAGSLTAAGTRLRPGAALLAATQTLSGAAVAALAATAALQATATLTVDATVVPGHITAGPGTVRAGQAPASVALTGPTGTVRRTA